MACRLFGAKPLPESIFFQESAFENAVCQYGGHFATSMVYASVGSEREAGVVVVVVGWERGRGRGRGGGGGGGGGGGDYHSTAVMQ